jgi:hypothetical protein
MHIAKVIGVGLSCVAATAAFMLACGGGPKTASAQSCASWQISIIDISATGPNCSGSYPRSPSACTLAAGWEPIAPWDTLNVLARRCAP